MPDFLRRLLSIDFKKITPAQLLVGGAVVLVALWLLSQVVNLALSLVPIALVVILAYLGFRVMSSRSAEAGAAPARSETRVEATVRDTKTAAEEGARKRLMVEQTVNPETGLLEVDLAKLEAKETEALNAAKQAAADVSAQLEERRRRLKGDS